MILSVLIILAQMTIFYSEVQLENHRDLPQDLSEIRGRLSVRLASTKNGGVFDEDDDANDTVENNANKTSPLEKWSASSLAISSGRDKNTDSFTEKASDFKIHKVVSEVVRTLRDTDVVCFIAPTGTGKSILAPYIAELLATAVGSRYRKALLAAPSVKHCAGTTQTFAKFFGDSNIKVSTFFNQYEELVCVKMFGEKCRGYLRRYKTGDAPAEFVFCPYNSVMRVLPHAKLNLLILDEVHESNDNVQVTMAMALKMMDGSLNKDSPEPTLNKLLLMTATYDEKERERLREYVMSHGRSFKILDFSDMLSSNKNVIMSCLVGNPLPRMFESTSLSKEISEEFKRKGLTIESKELLSVRNVKESLHDDIEDRMLTSIDYYMASAGENLQLRLNEKTGNYDMKTIIVILPGWELVDRLYSATFKLPHFKFKGEDGFNLIRLTSYVNDDPYVTMECRIEGKWEPKGRLGRIVFATNTISGLTVPDAAYIIDSCQTNSPTAFNKEGLRRMETNWIDNQMMLQRAGRTGRTTDGEYFLPYSGEKVEEIQHTRYGEELLNRNFEERHLMYKMMFRLKLMHEPTEKLRDELLTSMKIRGLYSEGTGFPKDVLLMDKLFNFLSPEHARIVIQGVRLGIGAHVIYLVADSISRVKFCHLGTSKRGKYNGPSTTKHTIERYSQYMDKKERTPEKYRRYPEKYVHGGDSIALADLLVSFFRVVPDHCKWIEIKDCAADESNFWSSTLCDLNQYVKEEGRGAVIRNAMQIVSALRGMGLVADISHESPRPLYSKRINRHIVSDENFCLNQDGRALLSALLTMHSSRVGELKCSGKVSVYEICRDKGDYKPLKVEQLSPESDYNHPKKWFFVQKKMYGRYSELFGKKGRRYSGLIDPITLKQLTNYININGEPMNSDGALTLNSSTAKIGMKIKIKDKSAHSDVVTSRFELARCLTLLTHSGNKEFINDLEKYIIGLWRECEKTEKDPPELPYSRGFSSCTTQFVQDSSIESERRMARRAGKKDDFTMNTREYELQGEKASSTTLQVAPSPPPRPPRISLHAAEHVMEYTRVMYDYVATQEDELSLKVGQSVLVGDEVYPGWHEVEVDGRRGLFPDNHHSRVRVSLSVKPTSKNVYALGDSFPLALSHDGPDKLVFHVKSPNNYDYSVATKFGFIGCGDTTRVTVNRLSGVAREDNFVVQFAVASEDATDAQEAFQRVTVDYEVTVRCYAK